MRPSASGRRISITAIIRSWHSWPPETTPAFAGSRTDMLDRFRMTTDPMIANSVAWWSVMAVSEEPNLSETVRLAELAVNGAPEPQKAALLNTLGAALYRAGRFAEAVRRLDEGIQKRKGVSIRADWVFLAMAHHRLGHHDEARRWLDRFRDRSPRPRPIRVLGRARDPVAPGRGGGGGPLGPDLPGRSLRALSQHPVQVGQLSLTLFDDDELRKPMRVDVESMSAWPCGLDRAF